MEAIWIKVLGLTGLLMLAVLMLPAAKRFNFPYTVLLAVVGCVLGAFSRLLIDNLQVLGVLGDFLSALDNFGITSEAVLFVFLPGLIFESALGIDVRRLMDDLAPILLLAVVGLLVSTFFIGYTLWMVSGVGLVACLLLGAIVSATDPVAVVAIFKDLRAPKRLMILVEGESLFNDATAIVMFTILAAMLTGSEEANVLAGTVSFLKVFIGGVGVGYLCAWVVCNIIARLGNVPLVKITLTICLAYLSFIFAEHYLHVSGVMAVVTSGLVVGSTGRATISPENWHALAETWEEIGFWANSIIFVLVGMAVAKILGDIGPRELGFLGILLLAAFVVRAAVIYGLLPLLSLFNMAAQVNNAFKTVMFWGGLRGAVSLALALAVLENPAFPGEVRYFVGVLVTGFVFFTLFVNATTIGAILKILGLGELSPADQAVRHRAMALSLSHIHGQIEHIVQEQQVEPEAARKFTRQYRERIDQVRDEMGRLGRLSPEDWLIIGLMNIGHQERKTYLKQFSEGFVSPRIVRILLAHTEDLMDAVKAHGVSGFRKAVEKSLGFGWRFRLAVRWQRRAGATGPLARKLADRFEILLATRTVVREVLIYGLPKVTELVGEETGERLKDIVEERLKATEQALTFLRLQYPDYSRMLQERYLGWVSLRLEENDYREMLENQVINGNIFQDLESELEDKANELNRRPVLNLGLDPKQLVAKVPLFCHLPSDRIDRIVRLLKPRLALPRERILKKGDPGEAMYFISHGCIHVDLKPEPICLGSGDFFGEIALLQDSPRMADVTAMGFCDLLVLYVKDFRALLDTDPETRKTIQRVARERMKKNGLM